eukprot:1826492-Amphidinium_carterae.1
MLKWSNMFYFLVDLFGVLGEQCPSVCAPLLPLALWGEPTSSIVCVGNIGTEELSSAMHDYEAQSLCTQVRVNAGPRHEP